MEHGHIVTATGQKSAEFSSKEGALKALEKAVKQLIIAHDEQKIVLQQIKDSPLPRMEEEIRRLDTLIMSLINGDSGEDWPFPAADHLPHMCHIN